VVCQRDFGKPRPVASTSFANVKIGDRRPKALKRVVN
jgi:hypothetical protein